MPVAGKMMFDRNLAGYTRLLFHSTFIWLAVMLTGMKRCVMLFATILCASQACGQSAVAREFLTRLEEARAAIRFEERLRTHEIALDALLKADAATLESALELWSQEDESYQLNDFVRMAWTRLAQIDVDRALKLIEGAGGEAFFEAAREVWAEIARTNPARAYVAAQSFAPANKDQHESKWLVQHIMTAVGASWFRVTGLTTLKRLSTLSHPELMAAAVFHGCVSEGKTAEHKLALLDRFCGDAKPVIRQNHVKSPDLCDELVRAAARADLPGTRAWVEKRFPSGAKRPGSGERDSRIDYARRALFSVWKESDVTAAVDWLMTQQSPDEDFDTNYAMTIAARAIAGEDCENMPATLAWLEKQPRSQDRVAALADFLDDDFGEDAVLRHSRETIAVWLSQRPMAEREAVVVAAAKDYIRLQAQGDFFAVVFPEPAKRREMAERLEKITGPASDPEVLAGNSHMLRVFDLPIHDKILAVSGADARRSRELAQLHELARTATDPARRREGLAALKWMKSASPAELRHVLLAYLCNHDMDWFAEDLLSAWVLQDWRSCEAFATDAPFSVAKRDDMLIHIFCEAAELHPDAALARLRELIQAKVLVQAALDGSASFSQVRWRTYYYGDMITHSLARGFLRQGDMKAFTVIQTLPTHWQGAAFEVLVERFTTPACGNALLARLEADEKNERQRHGRVLWAYYDLGIDRILGRLASISFADAVNWIEARPERLSEHEERGSPVNRMHESWRKIDTKAADAWIERVRREHPPKKSDSSAPVLKDASGPLLPPR